MSAKAPGAKRLRQALLAFVLLITTVAAAPTAVSAQDGRVLFDETVDGEISDDRSAPTQAALGAGANVITGTVVAGDVDYVTVTVPEGYELSSLELTDYEGDNDRSFIGVQEGSEFTEPPTGTEVANLLGYTLFGTETLNADILAAVGTGAGAQGFTGSLGAGSYTFWIQEVADVPSTYTFNFGTTKVPAAVSFRVENLQPADGFYFTPVWAGLHNADFDLFSVGERASAGLETLAETGDTSVLSGEFSRPGRLDTTIGAGPIAPGASVEGSIGIINPSAYPFLSIASMIIPSNDAFFGNGAPDAYRVFDEAGDFVGPFFIDVYAENIYDSGTEENTAFGSPFAVGLEGTEIDDPDGLVALHPDLLENIVGVETPVGTVIGSNGGGALDAGEPIARITVFVGEAPHVCGGQIVTVDLANGDVPTEGDDVIRGTSGDDVIDGLGGRDTICGLQGDDTIDGGDGFDSIFAGGGNDVIVGGAGNDLLVGGAGNDRIMGENGNDRIQGGTGADTLYGQGGQDLIRGGNGNDTIVGGTQADRLFGNLGADTISGEGGNDVIRGGAWLDTMDGGTGFDACTLTDPSGNVETRTSCERGVFGL